MATLQIVDQDTERRVRRIQSITITWMTIEAFLSLWSAWKAHSPAMMAFGGDSGIELLSAVVVLWRFRRHASERAETHAARVTGVLLFALAACVILVSVVSLSG